MKDIKIEIIGGPSPIKTTLNKYIRCQNCPYLTDTGNCLKVGGFYNSVSDKDCPIISTKTNIKKDGE